MKKIDTDESSFTPRMISHTSLDQVMVKMVSNVMVDSRKLVISTTVIPYLYELMT